MVLNVSSESMVGTLHFICFSSEVLFKPSLLQPIFTELFNCGFVLFSYSNKYITCIPKYNLRIPSYKFNLTAATSLYVIYIYIFNTICWTETAHDIII